MNAPRPFAAYDPEVCLNCAADLRAGDRFCRCCGQPNRTHARSLLAWVGEGLSSLFHVEGKLVNTLRDLPKPGRYAYRYLNGQRQRYVHPLRLLLFSSVVCFAALSTLGYLDADLSGGDAASLTFDPEGPTLRAVPLDSVDPAVSPETYAAIATRAESQARAKALNRAIDSVAAVRGELTQTAAELRGDVLDDRLDALDGEAERLGDEMKELVEAPSHPAYGRMRQIDQLRADLVAHDRAALLATDLIASGYAQGPQARRVLDTVLASYPMPGGWGKAATVQDVDWYTVFGDTLTASARLLAVGTPRQVVDSMALSNSLSRLFALKGVAMYQDGVENLLGYLLANLTWAILLFVPLIAFGYFLFYWRRMPYYTQNLAYAAILLSVTLLVGALSTALATVGLSAISTPVLALGLYAYMIAGEAYLYEVVWWKAWAKNVAIGLYGIIAFTVAVLLWLVLAVLLA